MLDPVRLRLLCELARRGTMTAVGAACGLTSSAVSQQLATLERQARVRLFERVGRRVQLTAEGHRLVRHAQTALDALEMAEADLRAADVPRGPIRVACFATAAARRLLPAIAAARQLYPDLHVIVQELDPAEAVEALRDRRCDMAITLMYNLIPRETPPGLLLQPLGVEPVLLALPAGHEAAGENIALQLLEREEWIAGSRDTADHELAQRACALAGFLPRITHTADDYTLILRMVQHGLGVALVPALATTNGVPPDVRVLPITTANLTRHTSVLTRQATARTPAIRALINLLT